MITKIEITEYIRAAMDGVELDAEVGTDEYWTEAAGYMDEYIAKVQAAVTKEFPGAEQEIDWYSGLGNGKAGIDAVSDCVDAYDADAESYACRLTIDTIRAECWEAIW